MIYAVNHTNYFDIPLTCRAIKMHSWVLIGKQPLYLSDRLFFFLNGAIWVDRKDKQDMRRAKERIQKHLRSGKSLIWFPEGTWNLTDSNLMLPMKWGIIDCAQKSHVPIIPIILEYSIQWKQCTACFGEAINPEGLSLEEGISALRDRMAELRWNIWEQKGITRRCYLDPQAQRKKLYQAVVDYPPLDLEYEQSIIFNPWSYQTD